MIAVVVVMMLASAASAQAAPVWTITSTANTTASAGGSLDYFIVAMNVGDPTDGATPYTMTINLPTGISGVSINPLNSDWVCSDPSGASTVTCTNSDEFDPGDGGAGAMILTTSVAAGAAGTLVASASIAGGGAADPASTVDPTRISDVPAGFGVDAFDAQATDVVGQPSTQAGGHPYAYATQLDFNAVTDPIFGPVWPAEPTKDIIVDLPVGFVGNPTTVAECTLAQLSTYVGGALQCPAEAQVGVATVTASRGDAAGIPFRFSGIPIYNMVSPPDASARFAMNVVGSVVTLDVSVRSQSDYGLTVNFRDVSEGLGIVKTSLTFWGTPADPTHDAQRYCARSTVPGCSSHSSLKPFLRNPTACAPTGVGLPETVHVDSWFHPGDFKDATFFNHVLPGYPLPPDQFGSPQGPTGCEEVPFAASVAAAPTERRAGAPTGFTFDVKASQTDDPNTGISPSDLKKAVVTLPEGVSISASAADGLAGCTSSQIGLHSTAAPTCPDASKVGNVTIETPLLNDPVTGSVYLATPHDNPFNSLIALYIVAKGPGVILKLPGKVDLDAATGQLTATFDNNPQIPFTDLRLTFSGGSRAQLMNPRSCGTYTTHSVMTSWSGRTVSSDSSFVLDLDAEGKTCAFAGFAPTLAAGTTNPIASGFSPFTLRLQRTDDDGEFRSLSSLSLPPGLLADVGSVSVRCTEAQADAHACPAESHIGTVNVGAGAGPDPIYVPGDVYLMGGFSSGAFRGDPFGLAVVVHATAGPFDLGYVVVKAGIQVHDDGSITTQTEPFPSILEGIPLQLKDVRVSLDRPRFIFNPTNCNRMAIAGTVTSTDGQSAGVSSRFQVGECANLAFKPSFTASTAGKTSKAGGASLHVHLATHEGPPANTTAPRESNIAKVDVQLPVVLPARLPTLQKACTAAQFASDPAGCPVGSFVGTVIAHTPILASPLSGPAILVSHGGEAFPDLVLVLQGEGVRINLTGHTQIKKGITFNHFETVPDAPVSSFDLTLPAGPHGVLTTDVPGRNLCANTRTVTVTKRVTRRVHGHTRRVTVKAKKAVAAPLLMPTTMTAQNGAVIHQNTKIAVTGCATVKAKVKKAAAKKGAKKR
jgi:hypothetical protein